MDQCAPGAVWAVAQGVETAERAARLHELGYERARGFFLGRPVPAEELTHRFTESPASLSGRS